MDNTPAAGAADDAYARLTAILNSPETLEDLRAIPSDRMTPVQKAALRDLGQHFECLAGETGGGATTRTRTHPQRRQRSARTETPFHPYQREPPNPMQCLVNLTSLGLAPAIQELLNDEDVEPTAFLTDGQILTNEMDAEDTMGDAFRLYYQYAADLERRTGMDPARWCFTMIMFYDLIKLIRPTGTGARVGSLMREDAIPFLEQAFHGDVARVGTAFEKLNEWSQIGSKLNVFCDEFGIGCVFFLAGKLTKSFLMKRFAKTGHHHDEAFARLRELGLQETADRTRANDFGQQIRSHLSRPFREGLTATRGNA